MLVGLVLPDYQSDSLQHLHGKLSPAAACKGACITRAGGGAVGGALLRTLMPLHCIIGPIIIIYQQAANGTNKAAELLVRLKREARRQMTSGNRSQRALPNETEGLTALPLSSSAGRLLQEPFDGHPRHTTCSSWAALQIKRQPWCA